MLEEQLIDISSINEIYILVLFVRSKFQRNNVCRKIFNSVFAGKLMQRILIENCTHSSVIE